MVCAGFAALAAGLVHRPHRQPQDRLRRLGTDNPPRPVTAPGGQRLRRRRGLLAVAVGAASWVGFGAGAGPALGVAAAIGLWIVLGRPASPSRAGVDDVALVLDLIAGCLAAGLALPEALAAAAVAGDPVTAAACRRTADLLGQGSPADEAWRGWLADPLLAPVAGSGVRAGRSGAALADDLRRRATRLRTQRRVQVRGRVQRSAVWLVVPLGLCFLPAFICVAVVPTVIGLFPSLH
jgi:hypothetical protein